MKGSASGTVDKPFTKIGEHSDFDRLNSVGGVKNEISAFLKHYVKGGRAKAEARFDGPNRAEAKSVALACLQESQAFVLDLHAFMSDFYDEMVTNADPNDAEKSAESEAWTVESFTSCIRSVLAAGASEIFTDDSGSRIGLVLWGYLRAHKLMREFRKDSFRQHPAVAATLMLHAFSSKTSTAIMASLQAEFLELSKAMKLIKITADKALELAR
jgi:hypothetical protein